MTFDEYFFPAMRLRLPSASAEYARLGLAGETGELLGYLAKSIRDKFEVDVDHVKKELGDILWFVSAIADDHGLTLEQVAETNLAKLTSRKERGVLRGSGDNR